MSFLSSLFGKSGSKAAEHPCSNCPSDCSIAGESCEVCKPYKEKLIDAIYWVEHMDELRDRYVVTGGQPGGTITCPHCGAPSEDRVTCTYCGSRISDEDGKIYVASASEIPNPILEAQDIIFDRYAAVGGKYAAQESSGLLSGLLELLTGGDSQDSGMGNKMTEDEIREAASLYAVSVATYLNGLDSGRYLTLAGKKQADQKAALSQQTYQGGYVQRPAVGLPPRPPAQRPPMMRPPFPPRSEGRWGQRTPQRQTQRPGPPQQRPGLTQQRPGPTQQRPQRPADPWGGRRSEPRMEKASGAKQPGSAKSPRNAKSPGSIKPGAGKDPRGGKRRMK